MANWVGSRLQLRGGGDAEGGMGEAERDRRVEQAAAELLESDGSEERGVRARPVGKHLPPPPSEEEDDSAPPTQVEPPSLGAEPFRVVREVVMICTRGARLLLRA